MCRAVLGLLPTALLVASDDTEDGTTLPMPRESDAESAGATFPMPSGGESTERDEQALLPGIQAIMTKWVCAEGFATLGAGKPSEKNTMYMREATVSKAKYWCATTARCKGFSFPDTLEHISLETPLQVYFYTDGSDLTVDPTWSAFQKCEGVLPRTGSGWTHDCPVDPPMPTPPTPVAQV